MFFCLVFVTHLCTSVYFVPCGRLLRKGCPLGSSFEVSHCKFVTFPLVSWAGFVLDCIDS